MWSKIFPSFNLGAALPDPRTGLSSGVSVTVPSSHPTPPEGHAVTEEQTPPAVIRFYSTAGEYGGLSNFSRHRVHLKGKTWPTTEHYFQSQKFVMRDKTP